MMYNNKLIVAIKSNGKVLREQGDTVFLPFGQEFTILVKNKNSLRCLVKIEIDGTDATENTSLIVPANGEVELERYIKNRNFESGNRFKFIERTAAIENGPRGIKVDDGLIRVEFEFEREAAPVKQFPTLYRDPYYDPFKQDKYFLVGQTYNSISGPQLLGEVKTAGDRGILRSRGISGSSLNASVEPQSMYNATSATVGNVQMQPLSQAASAPEVSLAGITVPGSVSDQKFVSGEWFPTDGVKHVMIMKLLGETAQGKQVIEAVTVKAKPRCVTCDHVNKATAKFCSQCGTSLTLV